MASQEVEEDGEMDYGDWTPVANRRGGIGVNRAEGGWMTSQGSKRSLEESSSDEGSGFVRKKAGKKEVKIILKFRKDEHISLSPIAVSRELKKKLGVVEMARILRDGSLFIVCKTEEQKNKAWEVESVCKKIISERKIVGDSKVTRGVITGIPVEEDLDKLKRSINGGEVSRIKRLMRTVNDERVESLSLLLEFQESVLPEKVKIGCMIFPVRPYIPPPLRCYKCQRYGHIAVACKGKQRCPKCGDEHRVEDCKEKVQDKCCNCGGQHRVTYGGCEVRKRAVKIQQVKTVNNISYAEAVKTVQGQK
ncbi:uncharacterized protein LOC118558667 [Fundulus heteroclitus]|uniref:uncharacterized protein LOC118558667 n=1 Tax=Fundulus heteroclitus TaxID=8078 RepID=UPI00165BBD16|nr:uncharacterized protein LOC118558667 [Fundulus heteroclitus]